MDNSCLGCDDDEWLAYIDYTHDPEAFIHPFLENNGIVNTPHVSVSLWYTPQVILSLVSVSFFRIFRDASAEIIALNPKDPGLN